MQLWRNLVTATREVLIISLRRNRFEIMKCRLVTQLKYKMAHCWVCALAKLHMLSVLYIHDEH